MEASSATDNDLTTLIGASAPALTLSLTASTAASADPIATLKNWNDGGFARAGPRQPLRSAAAPGTVNCTTHPAAVASNSHFPLPLGLGCGAKEETTGASFGFSFLGFRFSRLPFCSRFAMGILRLSEPRQYTPFVTSVPSGYPQPYTTKERVPHKRYVAMSLPDIISAPDGRRRRRAALHRLSAGWPAQVRRAPIEDVASRPLAHHRQNGGQS